MSGCHVSFAATGFLLRCKPRLLGSAARLTREAKLSSRENEGASHTMTLRLGNDQALTRIACLWRAGGRSGPIRERGPSWEWVHRGIAYICRCSRQSDDIPYRDRIIPTVEEFFSRYICSVRAVIIGDVKVLPTFPLFFPGFPRKNVCIIIERGVVFFSCPDFRNLSHKAKNRHHPHHQSCATSHSKHEPTSRKTA